MKPKWLERAVAYGLHITLCTNEDMFHKEYARLTRNGPNAGRVKNWCKPGHACVHTLESMHNGSTCQLVCIDAAHEDLKDDGIRVAAFLAHEATHCKQEYMRVIGEDKPSDEFEAYTVQNITQNLLDEYYRQVIEKK